MSGTKFGLVALFGIAIVGSSFCLTPLAAGTIPVVGVDGTVLDHTTTTFSSSGGEGGSLLQAVVQDSDTGRLDFVYQWTNTTGTQPFSTTSNQDFRGFSTNAGIVDNGTVLSNSLASAGFVTQLDSSALATAVALSEDASNNEFTWSYSVSNQAPSDFLPNTTTNIEVIKTNAVAYGKNGECIIVDGSPVQVAGFEPAATVPEPASVAMLLAAAVGLIGYCWRRRRIASA